MGVKDGAITALFVMVCTNVFSMILEGANLIGSAATGYNASQTVEALNATGAVGTWSGWAGQFYDLAFGIITFINTVGKLVNGFPAMLRAYNVPTFIVSPLNIVWSLLFFTFILVYVIAGRDS